MISQISHLTCHECGTVYDPSEVQTYCKKDNQPLVAHYNLGNKLISKMELCLRESSMWRYREFLPIEFDENIVSLGEGMSPLLKMRKLEEKNGATNIYIKDEGQNPTGSFKARGLSMAVSKAKELGIDTMCIPTAGNAGSALSAYCAKAGIKAKIYMPKATPSVFQKDCKVMGADVNIVEGNISDCGKLMREHNADGKWFDVTTLKEPYRLEGKKTMGYEIAEQLDWKLPDAILYPTGGGTGLIGIWRAFQELLSLGWVDHIPTKMIAVQVASCDPIVNAFSKQSTTSIPYENPGITIANGLRVPHAFGHKLILNTLYQSKGTAISISDEEIRKSISTVAQSEGIFLSPEGAAVYNAYEKLLQSKFLKATDSAVLLNTGSMYKYIENI